MKWLTGLASASLVLTSASLAHAAGDPKRGQSLVTARCGLCHAVAPDKIKRSGPPLLGVANRKAGSVVGFNYSAAMKGAKFAWTPAHLDQFLAAPSKKTPGTSMLIAVPNAQDRADIVAYLATLRR